MLVQMERYILDSSSNVKRRKKFTFHGKALKGQIPFICFAIENVDIRAEFHLSFPDVKQVTYLFFETNTDVSCQCCNVRFIV